MYTEIKAMFLPCGNFPWDGFCENKISASSDGSVWWWRCGRDASQQTRRTNQAVGFGFAWTWGPGAGVQRPASAPCSTGLPPLGLSSELTLLKTPHLKPSSGSYLSFPAGQVTTKGFTLLCPPLVWELHLILLLYTLAYSLEIREIVRKPELLNIKKNLTKQLHGILIKKAHLHNI